MGTCILTYTHPALHVSEALFQKLFAALGADPEKMVVKLERGYWVGESEI